MSLSTWAEETKARIKLLKKSHYLQRIQLELNFETTPRDSRYSSSLVDLMKKEETFLRDPNSPAAKTIVARVDEALKLETQNFFAKTVQQNNKRWVALKDKFQKERVSAIAEIAGNNTANKEKFNVNSSNIKQLPKRIPTMEEIEREADRLEVDYHKNWFKYENFNLQQAFKSQSARVESDWQSHEIALTDDYRSKKEKILGTTLTDSPSHTMQSPQDQRWQHPEKQKTLIHSAPVLTPTRHDNLNMSGEFGSSSSGRWAKGKREVELEKLDREYTASMESMERQKADAKRWLLRQQVRLSAQAEEVQKEKACIGELLETEFEDFHFLLDYLNQQLKAHESNT